MLPPVRALESIAALPQDPAFCCENGVLDVIGRGELMRLRGWEEPAASRKVCQDEWTPFSPAFRVIHPRPTSPATDPEDAARLAMRAAFEAFRSAQPRPVAGALEPLPGYQWNLLVLIHERPEALDLAQGSPALAWALANCDHFRPVYDQPPTAWAKWQVPNRQSQILEWLGFPGNDSTVRLLRKLTPSCIIPSSMRMLRSTLLQDARAAKMLRHQTRINVGIHSLCCHARLADHVTPALLAETAQDPREDEDTLRANLLADTLDLWEEITRPGSPPPFHTLRRIQTVHHELLAEYQRQLAAAKITAERNRSEFPPPPIPGDDQIIPLCSKTELQQESREQQNCVGSYYKRILRNRNLYIYRVLRPQRATLCLMRNPDGSWRRGELKGPKNTPVHHFTHMAIDDWLRESASAR